MNTKQIVPRGRKVYATITRNGMFIRKCVYARTAALFMFDKPGVNFQIRYVDNGNTVEMTDREFISKFIEGRFNA